MYEWCLQNVFLVFSMFISIQRFFSIVVRIVSDLWRSINLLLLWDSLTTTRRHVPPRPRGPPRWVLVPLVKTIPITIAIIILIMSDMIWIFHTYIHLLPSVNNLWWSLFSWFQIIDCILRHMRWLKSWPISNTNLKKLVDGSRQTFSYSPPTRCLWIIMRQSQTENGLIACQGWIIKSHQTDLMNTWTIS